MKRLLCLIGAAILVAGPVRAEEAAEAGYLAADLSAKPKQP